MELFENQKNRLEMTSGNTAIKENGVVNNNGKGYGAKNIEKSNRIHSKTSTGSRSVKK